MHRLTYIAEQRLFLVQLYFKYDSAGKGRRKFFGSGDECFENVCMKGHKTDTTATVKDNGSSCF